MTLLAKPHWLELKLPPVLLVVIAAGLIVISPAFSYFESVNQARQMSSWMPLTATGLMALGIIVAITGVYQFRQYQTTVNPVNPHHASSLVTTGIYRFSRNPMYLGMLIALLGWSAWWQQPFGLIITQLFNLYMSRFQIIPEERALQGQFGLQFDEYCQQTRRWL
ncbi:isoprenylcysteine carboxylmethyltransferase family protein [Neiella marina]|uniref:Isoprenylcysteine carboxylmethyltransferase family protein n=1 Tax=Neiella holothuriorum TaxID=2870530 RepID=A0ABS7EL48_9GAMM|nr:isoprenylcysteine carboxylmethyltransferase family protein [Neiella holothuriorum]MBW8192412.1 isoprenylcysteine carboxylmethyltransferase family protein [Neiella holothuriorum]